MKRFLLILVCLSLLFTCFLGTAQAARSKIPVTFAIASVQGDIGDVVPIEIMMSGKSEVGALDISIPVPTDYFEAVSIIDSNGEEVYWTKGNIVQTKTCVFVASNGAFSRDDCYGVTVATIDPEGFWESGIVCTFYFKIINQLPTEGVPLTFHRVLTTHHEKNYLEYDITCIDGFVVPKGTPVPDKPDIPVTTNTPRPVPKPTTKPNDSYQTSSRPADGTVVAMPSSSSPSANEGYADAYASNNSNIQSNRMDNQSTDTTVESFAETKTASVVSEISSSNTVSTLDAIQHATSTDLKADKDESPRWFIPIGIVVVVFSAVMVLVLLRRKNKV